MVGENSTMYSSSSSTLAGFGRMETSFPAAEKHFISGSVQATKVPTRNRDRSSLTEETAEGSRDIRRSLMVGGTIDPLVRGILFQEEKVFKKGRRTARSAISATRF